VSAGRAPPVVVRNTRTADFPAITALTKCVYPESPPWGEAALASHLVLFPEGQLVAEEEATGQIVGMAASLIVRWDDYDMNVTWRDITSGGFFTNHDPTGRTLYGAEVMVHPDQQGRGIGKLMYAARRDLCRRLKLLRIRAGARLRGYHRYADRMSAEEYVLAVVKGELSDPTLTFQLKQSFRVLAVVPNYLRYDPESLRWAAVIEWLNHKVAKPRHYAARDTRFIKP
jgi:GNAT superfamily N-acetyltransferase